ncbi:MAG: T9SS type A sorting domain-containing protein [Chitinophagaceae bacterium]
MKPTLPVLFLALILPFFSIAQPCTPQGTESVYGTNNVWIGYVYDNMDLTNYRGYVTEGTATNPSFDQSFGGGDVNYTTNGCPVFTSTFSVRYRLQKTFANGAYTFLVGGDDGYRLSIDGGATWIIDRWVDQGYASYSVSVPLNGTYDLVLEYYENGGGNRVSFTVTQDCTGTENTAVYGTNNVWNGYVYSGNNFTTYKGMVHEGNTSSPNFDQSFGGSNVLYPTTACNVLTEYFSVRYRLSKNFANGQYRFIVGADDGYRLSLDGGTTWVIDNWNAHSYTSTTYTTTLSGTRNVVLEYFENASDNRVSFSMQTMILLPVNLISFTGQGKNGVAELKWKITRDSDPAWFDIQRSTDALSFTTVNRLAGQAAMIGTNDINYQYNDALPKPDAYYYRLKMTDNAGVISYSPVIAVTTTSVNAAVTKIFPTIVDHSSLYIQSGKKLRKAAYSIFDLNGRLVTKQLHGSLEAGQPVNIFSKTPALSKGSYILKLSDGDEDISQHRFIVL